MKSIKTALLIIVSVIVLSVIFYFLPVKSLIGRLPLVNKFYNNTTIEIVTPNSKTRVWVNGKDYGETPVTIQDLPEGEYLVELERITTQESFYQKQSFNIELSKNTSARIDVEIGPDGTLNGSILYYTPAKATEKEHGYITVTSSVENPKVYIDKDLVNTQSVANLSLKTGQYQVKVYAEGYETVEIPVLIREGYQLNLKTFHFPIPIITNEE